MFERFTERARKVMSLARQETQRLNGNAIGSEHILLGILQEGGGVAAKALTELRHDAAKVPDLIVAIRQEIDRLAVPEAGLTLGQIPFTARSKKVLELAEETSLRLGAEIVGTEHLLLGILADEEGVPCQILKNFGMDPAVVRDKILEIIGAEVEVSHPENIALPNGAELQEMMTKVSTLIEEIDGRMSELAKDYGVHSDPFPIGKATVRLTKMGDRWAIECVRPGGQPERITGCRFDDKLEFLAKAKNFEGLYRAKILSLHRRAKMVLDGYLKEEK